MHRTRVITSIIGAALLLAIIAKGKLPLFWIVVSSATVTGLLEFYNIAEARQLPVYRLPGVLAGWLLSLAFVLAASERLAITDFTISLILLALMLYALLSKRPLPETLVGLAVTLFGICYVSWLLGHLTLLRGLPHGKELIFYLLLVVWSGDTGAYYTGKSLGKHTLSPVISPKKTVEGSIGGLLASVIASCVAKLTFLSILTCRDCIVLGLLLAIIAQLGDLCESMVKRSADVKDSGTILPGHGGILDRLDGVMFAAPLLYYYANLFLVA